MWWVLLFCQVQTGADELAQSGFERLKGLKYGLICNHTAVDRNGTHLLRLLEQADCPPQIIFTPEHGFSGLADRPIEGQQTSDPIQLVSLYGKEKKPSVEQLAGLDCLVFDIQDIGTRFYTYVSTMSQCLEAAAEAKIPMIILDRPNPLGGLLLDGPLPDPERCGAFICYLPIPLVHGMTMGELARFHNATLPQPAQLEVVTLAHWKREMLWDSCGLPWVNPSPNMRSFEEILLYPIIGCVEGIKDVSVGRGTDRPFEYFGSHHLDPERFLKDWKITRFGVSVSTTSFSVDPVNAEGQPSSYPYAGTKLNGLRWVINDRAHYDPIAAAGQLFQTLAKQIPPDQIQATVVRWWGDSASLSQILAGQSPATVRQSWQKNKDYQSFLAQRKAALLY